MPLNFSPALGGGLADGVQVNKDDVEAWLTQARDFVNALEQVSSLRGTRFYTTRQDAVDQITATPVTSSTDRILVLEDGVLTIRGRLASADDPLFTTAPQWGVMVRIHPFDPQPLVQTVDALKLRGTRFYSTRQDAVDQINANAIPAGTDRIIGLEDGVLTIRGRFHTADDPLFTTAPQWAVAERLHPSDSRVTTLSNVAGTGAAYTATGPKWADADGELVLFTPNVTNTASNPTLTVNGGGARAIRGVGVGTGPTPIGRLAAGVQVILRREGSFWRIVSDWDGLNVPNFGILAGSAGTPGAYTATLAGPSIDAGTILAWSPHLDNAENPTLAINGAAPRLIVCEDKLSPMPGQLRAGGHYLLKVQPGGYYVLGMSRPPQPEDQRVTRAAQAVALTRTMASSALEAGGTEDIGIKVTGGSNHAHWVASRGDRNEIIMVDGGLRWIDLSHMRPGTGDPITIRAITEARLYTPAQVYAVAAGSLVRVYRSTTADYVIEAAAGSVATSADTMPACEITGMAAGQSLASNFSTAGLHGLQRGLLDYSGQARRLFWINGATGSTGLLPESAGGPGYWWDDATGQPGPAALAWKAALDAKPANQPAPAFVYWALGQNDAGFMGNGITLSRYVNAYEALFGWMRAQLGASVPIIWSPLGSWDVDGAPSDAQASAIRWAEHLVRESVPSVHIGPHTFDLPRAFYDVHPTEQGQILQGYRLAADVAALIYGATPNRGPSVSALTAVDDGLSYRIDFTPGDPGDPLWRSFDGVDGLAFYRPGQDPLSGNPVAPTRYLWESNTRLRVYLAEAVPGATLLWPAGTMMEAIAGRYVRNTGNSPLRVGIGNHMPLRPTKISAA